MNATSVAVDKSSFFVLPQQLARPVAATPSLGDEQPGLLIVDAIGRAIISRGPATRLIEEEHAGGMIPGKGAVHERDVVLPQRNPGIRLGGAAPRASTRPVGRPLAPTCAWRRRLLCRGLLETDWSQDERGDRHS
jgi:hypothetical protein